MKEALQNIRQSADALIAQAADAAAVDELRVRFLGKKGELTAILKQMGQLSAEERPVVGALANEVREAITADIARRTKELESAALDRAPGRGGNRRHACRAKRPRRASATLSSRCWAS